MRLECCRPHSRNLPSAGLFVLGRMSMNYALLDSGYALDYDWRFLTCHLEYNEIQFRDMGSVKAWLSLVKHSNTYKHLEGQELQRYEPEPFHYGT
jgi:hypothetical protein